MTRPFPAKGVQNFMDYADDKSERGMNEKILVTGGAGFIGSFLVEKLVSLGKEVKVFDNFSTGSFENLSAVKDKIKVVKGDITKPKEIQNAAQDIDCVFHMAALSYAEESIANPREYNRVNIEGTFNTLEACRIRSVKRMVFPSTCLVYGPGTKKKKLSEELALNTTNPYGLTKATGEAYCRIFNELYSVETICLRIFNAYGPRMQNRVISKFAYLMFDNKPPVINGTGEQKRDFIYVSDIVEGILCGMHARKENCGKSYNIGTGKGLSLKEILAYMNGELHKKVPIEFRSRVLGETDVIIADTNLSKKEIGFSAKMPFDKGVKITMNWLKQNHEKNILKKN